MKTRLHPVLLRSAKAFGFALLAATLLSGCGGGGGGGCSSLGALAPSALCGKTADAPVAPVVVSPVNNPPVAVLQVPVGAIVGEGVVLDGSASSDPEGKPLRYTLELVGAPTGSRAQLSNVSASQSVFTPDVAGVYQFRLKVGDGDLESAPVLANLLVRRSNSVPVAVAGAANPSALVGQMVVLDGSSSFDDDRDLITYNWALVSRPADSVAILSGVASAKPAFVADRPGRYVASLIVNDGRVSSAAASVAIEVGQRNMPPVARMAEVGPVLVGTTVFLNGATSSDPNGDNLRYDWSFAGKPASSAASLTGANTVKPFFVPDVEGTYVVSLTVSDGSLSSEAVLSSVGAARANQRPAANIVARSNVLVGETVLLDGAGSTDANLDPLTYEWTVISKPQGSAAILQGATAPKATVAADRVGQYVLGLRVRDGALDSQLATHTITAATGNLPPVARADSLTTGAKVGNQVVLSGANSTDPDAGDLISYSWSIISSPPGSAASLSDPASVIPSFVPDRAGLYVAGLTVRDRSLAVSNLSTVVVEAGSVSNQAPVARVSAVNPIQVGSTAILDGTASSDADGDRITFEWQMVARPPGSSANLTPSAANSVRPTLTPDAEGDYLVQLVVSDGKVRSEPVIARVSAARANQRPAANLVARSSVLVGEAVLLDGAGSTDPNLDPLTYEWTVISKPSGSTAALQGASAPKATVLVDRAGQYVVGLKVRDGALDSQLVTHTITAANGNLPPVARAESLTTGAKVGSQVVLSGANSTDPDAGDLISYSWSIISSPPGSAASLSDPASVIPSFVPDRAGLYVAGLTVRDRSLAVSNLSTVVVEAGSVSNMAPVARVSAVNPVQVGAIAVLDGTLSGDADGDRITYEWQVLARPPGSSPTLNLSAANTVRPTLTPDAEGDYLVQLVVSDGRLRSEPVIARVTASRAAVNRMPTAVIRASGGSAYVGGTVVLDGYASADPEGGPLTYSWTLVSRPAAASSSSSGGTGGTGGTSGTGGTTSTTTTVQALQGTTTPTATLTADVAGSYVVGLRVRDPQGLESDMVTFVVTASAAPRPVAVITAPAAPRVVGQPMTLDGSASQAFGPGQMNYAWSVVSAPGNATITDARAAKTSIIPNAAGYWVFRLIVDQGRNSSGEAVNPSLPEVLVVLVN